MGDKGKSEKAAGMKFWLDEERRIIHFKLWGMWQQAEVDQFHAGIREHIKKLGRGPFCVYADITEYPPQRPEIASGAQQMMVHAMQAGMTKAANIVAKTTTKLQIKRISEEVKAPNFRFFTSEEEAMAWLMEETV